MKIPAAIWVASGLSSLAAAHSHAEAEDTLEPFVGWTQEDLDAKWGTDVWSYDPMHDEYPETDPDNVRSGDSAAYQPSPTSLIPAASNTLRLPTTLPY